MNWLRRIRNRLLPPSWNTVNRYYSNIIDLLLDQKKATLKELSEIEFRLHEIENDMRKMNAENIVLKGIIYESKCAIEKVITERDDEFDALKWNIIDSHNKNRANTDFIINELKHFRKNSQTYYWHNQYEREAIKNNYGLVLKDKEIKEKYFSLVNGLDEKSILTVNKILWRQGEYLTHNDLEMDLFTQTEQDELYAIDETFQKNVVKIDDSLYAYGHYLLPIKRFDPIVFYYKYCIDEIHLEYIKGKTIIDAGAFIGDTALIFSELDASNIISFEPIPENYELCKKTIEMNNLTKVILEKKALGSQKEEIIMYSAWAGSTIYPRKEDADNYTETYNVPVTTLDDYVQKNELNIGLIKMDIEGSEQACLLGAKHVITEQRPIMLICIYHNKDDFFGIKPMLESWDLNYRFKIRKPTVQNSTYETLLIAEPYELMN